MAIVHPFRAHRPPPELVLQVAAPPYDVIDTAEARALAAGNPHSFLHVSRPEIDLPEGTDEHSDAVYAQGRVALERMLGDGSLRADQFPTLYLYAQEMGTHRQVGVVACAAVSDYVTDVIRKHEKTRADKEDDRTRHIDELGAHDEPVFLTYFARPRIDELVAGVAARAALYDFRTADGVRHTVWATSLEERDALAAEFAAVPTLYVADGHHRSAAAARVHELRRGAPGEHDRFLAVIFPHDQMQILAYNRVVRDSAGRTSDELLAELARRFDLTDAVAPAPGRRQAFGVYLAGKWRTLSVRPETVDAADPVRSLDASLCQDQLLEPIFGIADPRRDDRVGFVGGIRGAAELERLVDSGRWTLALHLHPTSIEQLIAVSDAGRLMPPKSTWFEPKLRSGLFIHTM